jgi:hypothetical protein
MNWFLLVMSVLPAFLPWVSRGLQAVAQPMQAVQVVQQVAAHVQPQAQPVPPDAGQPGVVFHQGRWWKWDGRQWLMWAPVQPQMVTYVVR